MDASRELSARNAFKRDSKHRAKPLPKVVDLGQLAAIREGMRELHRVIGALEERISVLPILSAEELKATRKLLRDMGRIKGEK